MFDRVLNKHLNYSNFLLLPTPWTQDVNWAYIRRSEDILDLFWMSYVRSICVLCPGGKLMEDLRISSDAQFSVRKLTF